MKKRDFYIKKSGMGMDDRQKYKSKRMRWNVHDLLYEFYLLSVSRHQSNMDSVPYCEAALKMLMIEEIFELRIGENEESAKTRTALAIKNAAK